MVNKPRQIGTYAETRLAAYLTDEFGVDVGRGPLYGNRDRGDLIGVPLHMVEVKNTKTVDLHAWGCQVQAQMENAGMPYGVLVWSPPGVGAKNIGRWVTMEWCGDTPGGHRVPHVGPLNRLHRFVAEMDDYGFSTLVRDGEDWVTCRLLGSWVADTRERWPMLTRSK